MFSRSLLLSSAAAISLTVGAPAIAQAAPPAPHGFPGWYFSAEGGAITAHPTVSTDKTGTAGGTPQLGDDVGGYGAFVFGHSIHPDTDWRVGLAYAKFRDNFATTDPTADQVVTDASKLNFATADFEFGLYPIVQPAETLRLFAGLRALSENDLASYDKFGINTGSSLLVSSFAGIGPRIGADFEQRWSGTPWSVSAAASTAAIIGWRQSDASGSATVYNLEGALSFDYHTAPGAKFSLGVRAQQWWNLRGLSSDPHLTTNPDVLDGGPFVKVSWSMP